MNLPRLITKEVLFERVESDERGEDKTLERWLVSRGTRHGQKGWTASRYLPAKDDPNTFDWDESYMFFPTLDAAVIAFETENLTEGRRAF